MEPWESGLLHDDLEVAMRTRPRHPVLEESDAVLRYEELASRAAALAAGLRRAGFRPGEVALIQVSGGIRVAVAMYAVLLAGGVFSLVHPEVRADKLGFLLADSEARLLLTDAARARALPGVLASLPERDRPRVLLFDEVPGFESVRDASVPGAAPPSPGRTNQDLAALLYTSGSTGRPKAVMMSHGSMRFACGSLLEYLRLRAEDRILSVLPPSFDYGLYQLLMAVRCGATLVQEPAFATPAPVLQALAERDIHVFPGVPTLFALLRAMRRRTAFSFPSVRIVTNTAAALPASFLPDLRAMFPNARIFSMYGLTECKRVSFLEPELLARKPDSVGRAIPGTEAFVGDADGRPLPAGREGLLWVRGPHVMLGYWKRPEETARMLPKGAEGPVRLLCTQDRFRADAEGCLYFLGRSDDILKTRGEKVSPLEVERALLGIPGVAEVAVVGVVDELLGHALRAHVVVDPGVPADPAALLAGARERLEPVLVPREIRIESGLPRTANGKVDRAALQARP